MSLHLVPRSSEPVSGVSEAGRARVLVVDDDENTAWLLATLLQDSGYAVRTAGDAPHAIRMAESFSPNLALLDIGLPGVDGLELGIRLRRIPTLAGLGLVAVTGFGHHADWHAARDAGFDAFMLKPAAPLDLMATIRRVIRSRLLVDPVAY